jgi:GR25 family glycosyltransferase involved in LPS biosynthesis
MFMVCVYQIVIILKTKSQTKQFSSTTKSYVINLEKNKDRLALFTRRYFESDISKIELDRFNAVNGKTIDIRNYVTEKAYRQISNAEENGYRLRHYELTRGAVGCFLSHTALYAKLLKDDSKEFYIIFEDDAVVPPVVLKQIEYYLSNAPQDWDILLFGAIRQIIKEKTESYNKINAWWGLFGYAINKRGAKKFMDELEKQQKIDKQIDSMMSMMIVENKLNVYSTRKTLINHNADGLETDIQLPIKVAKNIDPFKYDDVELFIV